MRGKWLTIGIAAVITACGTGDQQRTVDVFAASSLTATFTELGDAFTSAHPEISLRFNFAGSSQLATQVTEGVPADVIATADVATMDRVADQVNAPIIFATTRPAILVEEGNPLEIDTLDDLVDPNLIVVFCAPEVPCGSYAGALVEESGLVIEPDSWERDATAIVTKVAIGEADAGIAYATDVIAADDRVDGVPIDTAIVAQYPIATVNGADPSAEAFVEFVTSTEGRAILERHGFGAP